MQVTTDDIASLVGNLHIADDAPRDSEHNLRNALHVLVRSANIINSQAQSTRALAANVNLSSRPPIMEVCSLRQQTKKFAKITQDLQDAIDALNKATEHWVVLHLRSLGSESPLIASKVFPHFDKQIKIIVREILENSSDQDLLWKIAEECFNQSIKPYGTLDVEDYFAPLEEACLEWPYDPDFESEAYYEHENRLDLDEHYAAAFHSRELRKREVRYKERQSWPAFWIQVLHNAPSGPTLFHPTTGFSTLRLDATPPYLFRTFDAASSGQNDESVIASSASISHLRGSSRADILSLEAREAVKLLYEHFNKPCFGGEGTDNLMSWTSSLIFAIQYALWRIRKRGCHPSQVKICAVDTRSFPQGQFVQDIWLLKAYHTTAIRVGDPERKFFDFRMENEDFYNGEYLSQGKVRHTGRSSTVSLDDLINAGLFRLFPEFEDPGGAEQWTKRVLGLRRIWWVEQGTADQEIRLALDLAYKCFAQFERTEVAAILLTFKNRKGSTLAPTDKEQRPRWADKPIEVRRYWIANKAIGSSIRYCNTWTRLQPYETLREVFD